MEKEKTVILTGKAYTELKKKLQASQNAWVSIGTEDNPQTVKVKEVFPDSDPDFAPDAGNYPSIGEDTEIQVRIKYEE